MAYTLTPTEPGLTPDSADAGNRWTLNFGPQHPATHTTLRLVLELDGERVIHCTPHIGYLHSGFEKLGEHLNYNQYVTIVDRMDYSAPIYNEIAWHFATEKLMGIELTPRCKALRTIAGELGRIQSHLLCISAAGLDLGALTAFLYVFNEKERIYDILEYMSGQRFHNSWTRVGGLNQDLPDEVDVPQNGAHVYRRRTASRPLEDVEKLLNKQSHLSLIARRACRHDQHVTMRSTWSLSGPDRPGGQRFVRRRFAKRRTVSLLCRQLGWAGG